MANIIISYFRIQENDIKKTGCVFEGLVNELSKYGNNVICINTALFNNYSSNVVRNKELNNYLKSIVEEFVPDIIFAFNNRVPQCIIDSTKCPVVVWDGDHPYYFCDKESIISNKKRYIIFSIVNEWKKDYDRLGFENKIYYMPMATSVTSCCEKIISNISFLGVRFYYSKKFMNIIGNHQLFEKYYDMMNEFYKESTYDYNYLFSKYFSRLAETMKPEEQDLYPLFDIRAACLSSLSELGLRFCAHNGRWEFLDETFPQLAASFDPTIVWNLQETCKFYNSSLVSLSPMHPQAKGAGFSWRIFDVMASNSCILSSYSSELKKITQNYVDIPMFKSPSQCYSLAKKLIDNESYRMSIVSGCQQFIDENSRWIHRFSEMEKILDLSLISNTKKSGYVNYLFLDEKFNRLCQEKATDMLALSRFEAKHRKFSYKLNKAKIRLRSLFYFNKKERKAFRKESRELLEKRYNYAERIDWYNKQQKKNAEIALSLREKCKQEKLKVAFLVIYDSVFPAEPVFKKMLNSKIFEPKIIVIPDTLRGRENMYDNLFKTYTSLYEKYGDRVLLSYHKEADNFVDFAKVIDIVCSANPYDSMTHDYYRIRTLLEKNIISFYTNYGYPTVYYARKVFETQFCSLLWKYFIETEEHIPEYENSQIIKGKNTVVMGYPKMDALADCNLEKGKTRKRIILAPHHTVKSVGGLQLSNFLDYAEFFLELPKLYPDIDFIFRPHPMLFTTLARDDMWGNDRVEEYINQINNTPNMIYQNGGDYFDTFMNSDGIIHDCSSFMAEWLYTEKMGCYLLRNKEEIEEQFVPFGVKLVNLYEHAFNKDDIINYIENVIAGRDERRDERIQTVRECLKVNYPHSSDKIVEYLESQFI